MATTAKRRKVPGNGKPTFANVMYFKQKQQDGSFADYRFAGSFGPAHLFTRLTMVDPTLPKLLASFTSGTTTRQDVAFVYEDRVAISETAFGRTFAAIKAIATDPAFVAAGISYDAATHQIIFDATKMPPPPFTVDEEAGTVTLEITNGSVKYSCTIDPLGVVAKITKPDGTEVEVGGRIKLEDFTNLTQAQAQELIVNMDTTPDMLRQLTEIKTPPSTPIVNQPTSISKVPLQYVDGYFGMEYRRQVAAAVSPDSVTSVVFPPIDPATGRPAFESRFSFLAVPTPSSTPDAPEFYYLAKDAQTKRVYVCDNAGWTRVDRFNYVSDNEGHFHITLTPTAATNPTLALQVPVKDASGFPPVLNGDFLQAVSDFIQEPPARINIGRSSDPKAGLRTVGSQMYGGVLGPDVDFQAYTDSKALRPVRTSSIELDRTTTLESGPTPPPKGPRKNPYLPQPLKAIKRKPIKLNEDAIRYGGTAAGLAMLPLILLGPVGMVLAAIGVAVICGAQILANNLYKINDNPLNQLTTTFINDLTKKQNDAEHDAQHFWEIETEYGNTRDNLQSLREQIDGPDFGNDQIGAMFRRMFPDDPAFNAFWNSPTAYRDSFLEQLQNVNAMPATNPAEIAARQAAQAQLLSDFHITASRASIFDDPYTVIDPANPSGPPITISAEDAVKNGITTLNTYETVEHRMQTAHDEVGDIIQFGSSYALERIIAQDLSLVTPGYGLDQFVEEHKLDLARRFMLRSDITESERESFFSKLTNDQRKVVLKAMKTVEEAIQQADVIGANQATWDGQFAQIIQTCDTLIAIGEERTFDDTQLKTVDQTRADAQTMLWAIANEDARRNNRPRQRINNQEITHMMTLFHGGVLAHSPFTGIFPGDGGRPIRTSNAATTAYRITLATRAALFANPRIAELLGDDVMASASLLTSGASVSTIDNDSLDAVLADLETRLTSPADAALLAQVQEARTLTDKRTHAREEVSSETTSYLYHNADVARLLSRYPTTIPASTVAQINARVTAMAADPRYAHFASLHPDRQREIARMMLDSRSICMARDWDVHGAPTAGNPTPADRVREVEAATKEFNALLEQLATGQLAEKLVAEEERRTVEADTTASVHNPATTRAQARDQLLSMDNLLDHYNVPAASRPGIIATASGLATGTPPTMTRANLLQAIYEENRALTFSDATPEPVNPAIVRTFDSVVNGRVPAYDMTDPAQVRTVRGEVDRLRTLRRDRSSQSLDPLRQIAGRTQIDYEFDTQTGAHPRGNTTPRQTRAETRYRQALTETETFLNNVNAVETALRDVKECLTVATIPAADRVARMQTLETALGAVLTPRQMRRLFRTGLRRNATTFAELEHDLGTTPSRFDARKFRTLASFITKRIMAEDEKRAKRLQARKKKGTKHKDKQAKKRGTPLVQRHNNRIHSYQTNRRVVLKKRAETTRTANRAGEVENLAPKSTEGVAQSRRSHHVERE